MKKLGMLLMACVLVLGLSQCKKTEIISPNGNHGGVTITLNFNNDLNSKANVDPTGSGGQLPYAPVSYETGDRIYVGYNNAYVGYLDYTSGGSFSGTVDIESAVGEQPLHFYMLGGKGFTPVQDGNTFTIDISDQISKLPVVSYAASNEPYAGEGTYTAKLMNKGALVKFNVNKPSGYDQAGTCIVGLNNYVTVDFTTPGEMGNGFTFTQVNDGAITIDSKIGDVFAVLLPQEALPEGGDMSVFSGRRKGTRPAMPKIEGNEYLTNDGAGYDLTVTTEFQPTSTLSGLFKVNADGKMVRFAKGNLKATTTDEWATWTWGFMDTQYYYETKSDVGNNYANRTEVSLFGWATSGYNLRGYESNSYFYKPNCTYGGTSSSYAPVVNEMTDITGEYAKGDWGYNRITNNGYKQWRVLTKAEWEYLKSNHTMGWTKIPASNNNNRGYGLMMLPYGVSGTIKTSYSVSEWAAMEEQGAVFFAVCGTRGLSGSNYTNISSASVDNYCWLWTSSCQSNNGNNYIATITWASSTIGIDTKFGGYGCSVRLVCE